MLNTLLTLLVFQTLGEGLVYVLSLPVPGPVIGMLLLLFYLILKKDTAAKLAPSASQLLSNMALLFVPACVGLSVHLHRIGQEWLAIAAALIVSTVVSLVVTAFVIKSLKRRSEK
ncbi:CidA/LrgA family protein [Oxalicibacterium solurbis]|uniref:Murein hydrolase transporter LrgA n=1 Tax=Oxalicibacterium solurbis TaxID=69280 RepID=A0A8J3AU53_9BURK|nr:CidA/LrgA family protein [Oxalicibacterium solurbis]GGI53694.1 murein hydrolase transporter LrgA [Oxalicibacterium solurbis]